MIIPKLEHSQWGQIVITALGSCNHQQLPPAPGPAPLGQMEKEKMGFLLVLDAQLNFLAFFFL